MAYNVLPVAVLRIGVARPAIATGFAQGICTIGISCGAFVLAIACNAVAMNRFTIIADLSTGDFTQVGLGVALIIPRAIF